MNVVIKTVSTAQQAMNLRLAVIRQKAGMEKASMEMATGLKQDVFAEGGTSPSRSMELRAQKTANDAYLMSNQTLAARMEVTVLSLDEIRKVTGDFKNLLISGDIASMNRSTLQDAAGNVMQALVSTLNGTYNGEYIFSGTQTDQRPLEIGADNLVSYAGGTDDVTSRIGDDTVLSHGIRADNPAFAEIFDALSTIINTDLDAIVDFTSFQRATAEAISAAEVEIVAMQAKLGDSQARLDRVITRQNDMSRIFTSSILDIEGVKPEEAAIRVEAISNQLQSTFAVTARMSQLSFLNFIR